MTGFGILSLEAVEAVESEDLRKERHSATANRHVRTRLLSLFPKGGKAGRHEEQRYQISSNGSTTRSPAAAEGGGCGADPTMRSSA